jgi:hypothetical protein
MKSIPALLAISLLALPATAMETPAGCAWLCGDWTLDVTQGDAIEPLVDAALLKVKEPGPRKVGRAPRDAGLAQAAPQEVGVAASAEPAALSPARAALRKQLLDDLEPEASLGFEAEARVILLGTSGGELRRLYPGEPHTRVTSRGCITIATDWKKNALVVREEQARTLRISDTFALLPDGALQLTRVVERSGIKPLTLRALYRRGRTEGLESVPLEPTQKNAP